MTKIYEFRSFAGNAMRMLSPYGILLPAYEWEEKKYLHTRTLQEETKLFQLFRAARKQSCIFRIADCYLCN